MAGRAVGPTSVAVGDAVLHGTHVVVATGAKPAALPFLAPNISPW